MFRLILRLKQSARGKLRSFAAQANVPKLPVGCYPLVSSSSQSRPGAPLGFPKSPKSRKFQLEVEIQAWLALQRELLVELLLGTSFLLACLTYNGFFGFWDPNTSIWVRTWY